MSDGTRPAQAPAVAPQRVLGFALAPGGAARRHRDGPEPQRVLGFPATWLEGPDATWLDALAHPFRALGALARRRVKSPGR
ncbi:MAG: hypothetical protein M0004_09390 [Actinomycetota bacterium]|nr:hypothetical protein [Actinomycetota bacterium]